MKKNILFIFLSMAVLFSNALATEQNINFDKIAKNDKQIMVFFHMNNCGYCNRMDKQTLQDKYIKENIKKYFIFIDINIDDQKTILFKNKQYDSKDFANSLDVNFFPTVVFLNDEDEISYKARGFRSVEKFQQILNYMKTKSFENMSFFEYSEQKDKE
ncbi:MAG: thioredoxin fold domain-containing protein [Arcobacteraceae bacterium]